MKVLLFGGTGMVGQAALRAALADDRVTRLTSVGRRPLGTSHPKLVDLVVQDVGDLSPVLDQVNGHDACLWPLGVSSMGLNEADFRQVTYDLTLRAAKTLKQLNPRMAFLYVSGAGTDLHGRQMWARVKGQTEADLLQMFEHAYMFRPGAIRGLDGISSRVRFYRVLEKGLGPIIGLLPESVATDTRRIGQAMVNAVIERRPSGIVDQRQINAWARPGA